MNGRARRCNPDEFYVHASSLEAGHYPGLKTFGSKLIKHDLPQPTKRSARWYHWWWILPKSCNEFSLERWRDQRVSAKQAMINGSTTNVQWTLSGQKMASTASFTSFKLVLKPYVPQSDQNVIERCELNAPRRGDARSRKAAIGQRHRFSPVRLVDSLDQMSLVQEGDVLVTDSDRPDWEPDEESVCDCH